VPSFWCSSISEVANLSAAPGAGFGAEPDSLAHASHRCISVGSLFSESISVRCTVARAFLQTWQTLFIASRSGGGSGVANRDSSGRRSVLGATFLNPTLVRGRGALQTDPGFGGSVGASGPDEDRTRERKWSPRSAKFRNAS